jgi:sugar phosphate isomerase/epimerase
MLKPAFSTVACPEWTLDRVPAAAREFGFGAVELRTFGPASSDLPCDPALTEESKTRAAFARHGIEIVSLATSCRFDEPILPPVIGAVISDTERSVREANRAVDLAIGLGCPVVRVFGFEIPARERRVSGLARIADRLRLVLDHARASGVKIAVENGGSFPRALDLLEILDAVRHPLLGACYSIDQGHAAGETPADAVRELGDRLLIARLKDWKAGRPAPLGEGELPCREYLTALAEAGFDGPVVYEWPRMWVRDIEPAETVLPRAARTLYSWIGGEADAAGAGQQGAARLSGV